MCASTVRYLFPFVVSCKPLYTTQIFKHLTERIVRRWQAGGRIVPASFLIVIAEYICNNIFWPPCLALLAQRPLVGRCFQHVELLWMQVHASLLMKRFLKHKEKHLLTAHFVMMPFRVGWQLSKNDSGCRNSQLHKMGISAADWARPSVYWAPGGTERLRIQQQNQASHQDVQQAWRRLGGFSSTPGLQCFSPS